jgi:hypothetical protein
MFTGSSLATLFVAIAAAIPAQFDRRAGAPVAEPIPSNCTIANPVLCTCNEYCPPVSYTPYRPTAATLTPANSGPFLYGYYLDPSSSQVTSGNATSLLQMCLETCYGYGNIGDCVSVYQAYNYPSPPLYGAPGGNPTVACLLFDRPLAVTDFEVVPEDQRDEWTDPRSANIVCPISDALTSSTAGPTASASE